MGFHVAEVYCCVEIGNLLCLTPIHTYYTALILYNVPLYALYSTCICPCSNTLINFNSIHFVNAVDGMNSASSVRADVTIISAATATATAVVLIAMAIIVTLIIVGLLICRKQKVRGMPCFFELIVVDGTVQVTHIVYLRQII